MKKCWGVNMSKQSIASLHTVFEANRNEENAIHMEKYMRNQFPFIGLKAKERRDLSKPFLREVDYDSEHVSEMIRTLWEMPEREYQYVAVDYLVKHKKRLTDHHIELLEYMITTKSWWDTVDAIASHLVGNVFQTYPQLILEKGDEWLSSNHLWLQRTMILFQLKYKNQTNEKRLYSIINRLKHIEEFFIQKAIGWALREYSKTNPTSVAEFIEKQSLSKLAIREGSKYLERKR